MIRPPLDHADAARDDARKEAASGLVENERVGQVVFAALEESRAAMRAEGVDAAGAFEGVRDGSGARGPAVSGAD